MAVPTCVEVQRIQAGEVNMGLIINPPHRHLRFMDYKLGNYPRKCELLDEVAKQHGLRKVFTLIEKHDCSSWRKVGFFQEGTYPTFFRTTDAMVMSRLYDDMGNPTSPPQVNNWNLPDLHSRLHLSSGKPPGAAIKWIKEEKKRLDIISDLSGVARTLPFARSDAPDRALRATASNYESLVLAEIDEGYGHATIAFASPPRSEAELALSTWAGKSILSSIDHKEVHNLFGLTQKSDDWGHALFLSLGFKMTGCLSNHLLIDEQFSSACIWHRKFTRPKALEQQADTQPFRIYT